ncbi:MAG: ATP-dependent DNA helicase RecQ [Bacteroidota bacterium]|nr:ATP-dependent DNA helicase RecQ [Bacteroidota bacterium]
MQSNFKEDIYNTLKKYWGFNQFRPLQEDIILSVLSKKDTLALLPTGGGKSLCFQVPGLVLGGTCLVVSPLIALMNDQVHNLQKKGIAAVAISAAMNFKEIEVALNNAALGHVQFLYVSPERLQNKDFKQKLSYLPITLIAVDEAHCISQWGYDFRPSYLNIADVRNYFPEAPIIALTASATADVVEDIQLKLNFKNSKVFRQSFTRKNLRYVVQLEEDKINRLLKLIKNIGGSGIVYVRNRKKTEAIAQILKQQKISSAAYHAGLTYSQRQNIQQHWIDNHTQVICATNAFGMGIDKPDVRFVVHLDLPDSLEAYFQEAGRGGRDGKTSYSSIFYTTADKQKLLDNYAQAFPEIEYIKQTYQAIGNYYQIAVGAGNGLCVDFDLEKICNSYNLQKNLVYNSIRFLEKENYLSLLDTGYESSKVMMLANKDDMYNFQLKNPKYEPVIKALLRSYGGLFENYCFINEKEIAYRSKTNAFTVSEYLQVLDKQKILSYVEQSSIPKLILLQDRINTKYIEFSPANYNKLKQIYLQRINSVIDYIDNNKVCRQSQLLIYFNEFDYKDCGYCDVCINKKPKSTTKIKQQLIDELKLQPSSLIALSQKMSKHSNELWVNALNELVDDNQVQINDDLYSLRKK